MVALIGLLALVACGQEPTARLGSIPTAPADAIEIPEDVLPFDRAAVVESLQGSVGASEVEVLVYLVPPAVTFETLEAHYKAFLDTGWEAQETPAMATARAQGRAAVLWSNERTGEILSLQHMPAPGYAGNLLIVLYASKDQESSRGGERQTHVVRVTVTERGS